MTIYRLKTWPLYFEMVRAGRKPFEYRRNDRDFKAGDRLVLQEFSPPAFSGVGPKSFVESVLSLGYTGREITATVSCVLDNTCPLFEALPAGYCLLGLRDIEAQP